jgi:hypothetical protein
MTIAGAPWQTALAQCSRAETQRLDPMKRRRERPACMGTGAEIQNCAILGYLPGVAFGTRKVD